MELKCIYSNEVNKDSLFTDYCFNGGDNFRLEINSKEPVIYLTESDAKKLALYILGKLGENK